MARTKKAAAEIRKIYSRPFLRSWTNPRTDETRVYINAYSKDRNAPKVWIVPAQDNEGNKFQVHTDAAMREWNISRERDNYLQGEFEKIALRILGQCEVRGWNEIVKVGKQDGR